MNSRALAESIQQAQIGPEAGERLERLAALESGPIRMRPIIEVEEPDPEPSWVDRLLRRKPTAGRRITKTHGH